MAGGLLVAVVEVMLLFLFLSVWWCGGPLFCVVIVVWVLEA